MADIGGYVYYSPSSCVADSDVVIEIEVPGYDTVYAQPRKPIPNIPIILISVISGVETDYACVKTDDAGKYIFTNVNDGVYKVIEAFGFEQSCAQSTIDFDLEKKPLTGITIIPKDPTVEYILTQKFETYGANQIVSLYPNTVFIQVDNNSVFDMSSSSYEAIETVDFKDAPEKCEELVISDFLEFQNTIINGENLIQVVDKGTFGSNPSGTPSSSDFSDSYVTENFTAFESQPYSPIGPSKDHYAITNIAAYTTFDKSWFNIADHTKGDETGRFMIVNGDDTGKAFFRTTINVESNTCYLFSCWAMNILRCKGSALPEFSINIYDSTTGEQLFYSIFNKQHPMEVTDIPTWRQIGTILKPEDVLNRTNLTIEFISEGMEAQGNDYAIDDITIVAVKRGVVVYKSLDPEMESVTLKEELNYVCTITNTNENEIITHLMFKDMLQEGATIKDNKIYVSCSDIKDQPYILETNPNISIDNVGIDVGKILSNLVTESDPYYTLFKLEEIPSRVTITIKFTVIVNSVNETVPYNNVKNRFRIQFLSELDTQNVQTVASNEVITPVVFPVLKAKKSLSKIVNGIPIEIGQGEAIHDGSEVLYSIIITNTGKAPAQDIKIYDEFDELFLYEFPGELPDCAIKITKQITSPSNLKQENAETVPCDDISSYKIHGIQIDKITIPAATETENGICIVNIYGRLES